MSSFVVGMLIFTAIWVFSGILGFILDSVWNRKIIPVDFLYFCVFGPILLWFVLFMGENDG